MPELDTTPQPPDFGIPDYELGLPPIAQARPGDGVVAKHLANPLVRDGLGSVMAGVTDYYRGLAERGHAVHEIIRGVTAGGIVIALAEYVEPDAVHDIQPSDEGLTHVFGSLGKYALFLTHVDKITTPDGHTLAQTPRQLTERPQGRDGYRTSGVVVENGEVTLKVPQREGYPVVISDQRVLPFAQAAFGETRAKAAEESLSWIDGQGKQLVSEGLATEQAVDDFYTAQLAEYYAHPEWFDNPADPLEGVADEQLAAILTATGKGHIQPAYIKRLSLQHVKDNNVVHPDDIATIRDLITVVREERTPDNYHYGSMPRERAAQRALSSARNARLRAALHIPPTD